MRSNYTAIIREEENGWIGWVQEIPGVNCQEPSREALLDSLTVTLREALEFNRMGAIRNLGVPRPR